MKLVKEIRSSAGEVHFRRWAILSTRFGSIFLHQILKEDKDPHCHDHPWSFVSIVLWGCYMEYRDTGEAIIRGPLSVSKMSATGAYHKILAVLKPTWTLVFASAPKHSWGYRVGDEWVPHAVYRERRRKWQSIL